MSNDNIYRMMNEIETDITEFTGASCSDIETKRTKKKVMDKLHAKKRGRALGCCRLCRAGRRTAGRWAFWFTGKRRC